MGLFSFIKSELIDIIEWLQDGDSDVMVYRFERHDNEIKNGAKLIVRESQTAVFINEGKMADIFGPGSYTLETKNLPILTTLKGWKYGFDSPFKAEVYFVNMKRFTNLKWGTPNLFYIRDKDFGRVSIRAFGTYSMRVNAPEKFITEVVGTSAEFSTDEIRDELRSMIVTKFIDAVGESGIPLLDFAQNYSDLSEFCQKKLASEYLQYGLEITGFAINSINLPENLQAKLDEGTGMNMIGNVNRYTQMKTADGIFAAGNNPNSGGGMDGMLGMAMMQQMMQQKQQPYNQQSAPPPPPTGSQYFVSVAGQQQGPFDLNTLRQLIAQQQINQQTYVWKQGMANWEAAMQVPEVASLFGSIPPPPPPR